MKGLAIVSVLLALSPARPAAGQDPAPDAQPKPGECWYVFEAPDRESGQRIVAGTGSITYSPTEVAQAYEIKVLAVTAIIPELAANPNLRQVEDLEMQIEGKELLNSNGFTTFNQLKIFSTVLSMEVKMEQKGVAWKVVVKAGETTLPAALTEGVPEAYGSIETALLAAARAKKLAANAELQFPMLSVDEKFQMNTTQVTASVSGKVKVKWPAGGDAEIEVWNVTSEIADRVTGARIATEYQVTEEGYVHQIEIGELRVIRVKDKEAARGRRSWSMNSRRDIFDKSQAKVGIAEDEDPDPRGPKPSPEEEIKALTASKKAIDDFRKVIEQDPPRDAKLRGYQKVIKAFDLAAKTIKSPDGKNKFEGYKRDLERMLGTEDAILMQALAFGDDLSQLLAVKKDTKGAMAIIEKLKVLADSRPIQGKPEQKEIQALIETGRKAIGSIELGGYLTNIEIKGLIYHWENQVDVAAIEFDFAGAPLQVRHPISMTRPRAMVLVTGLPPREGHGDFEIMKEGDFIEDLKGPAEPIQLKTIRLNEIIFASGKVEASLPFPPPKKEKAGSREKPGR